MTLTEQWKNGEVPRGWYYVLLFSNEEYIAFIDGKWVVDDRLVESDITEVLAPVPSYQEYQQLKELLKECHIQPLNKPIRVIQYDIKKAELKDLLKRIYEAIGEKQ